jgi:hypothetical protein
VITHPEENAYILSSRIEPCLELFTVQAMMAVVTVALLSPSPITSSDTRDTVAHAYVTTTGY